MDRKEFDKHFSTDISKSLLRFTNETVFRSSRYLFVKTVSREQFAYCTYCNKQHRTKERLKHKQLATATCPHCKSECKVRSAGISRMYMVDRAVLVWYEKSKVNPHAITARVISVVRDYSGDFKNVETQFNCSYQYLFEPGGSFWAPRWEHVKPNPKITSAFDRFYSGYGTWPRFRSDSNIRHAVKGTPFQYSTWEKYVRYANQSYVTDMVHFFDLAARYPCVEYLTKVGLQGMVWAKLYNTQTHGAINWNGKSLPKVLRITKQDIKEIRESGLDFQPHHLRYFQKARKKNLDISISEAFILADLEYSSYRDYYKIALTFGPEQKIVKYFLKQIKKGHYSKATDVLIDWRDYRKQCAELGISLNEEHNLFPNDLHAVHTKLTHRIKIKRDKLINQKIKQRVLTLNKLTFEWNGYLIRPAHSSIELFEEGKRLKHCVGSYSKDYAEGKTDIFLIREIENPDAPFYTMEVHQNKVIQCRGLRNCSMTEDVKKLVEQFNSQKLNPKKNRAKAGVAV